MLSKSDRGLTLSPTINRFLERHLPVGLYQRSLIIVIAPIVVLQSIMAGIVLERHWDNVTKVLARSLAREIALMIDLYDQSPKTDAAREDITRMAKRLRLGLTVVENAKLPPPLETPLFSLVDEKLARYLTNEVGRPFWIDSWTESGSVNVQVQADNNVVFRINVSDDRAYAASTDVFLLWMLISSLVLVAIAVAFLRNQIVPILELANAAKSFGMGRDYGDIRPRGAAEVREATMAFLAMKDRIEKHVEQRTAMLAGVSHDLRTILTRFKLEIAFLGKGAKVQALKDDVEEMQRMLEGYMAFVRGDGGERSEPVGLPPLLRSVAEAASRGSKPIVVETPDELTVKVKPNAFRRLMANLIGNAARYAKTVKVSAAADGHHLTVMIDDDGPGIPAHLREDVFRPFVRLDHARNQDETGTGLGLAIARDIARAHGGDIKLSDSPMGGLRAAVEVPV